MCCVLAIYIGTVMGKFGPRLSSEPALQWLIRIATLYELVEHRAVSILSGYFGPIKKKSVRLLRQIP